MEKSDIKIEFLKQRKSLIFEGFDHMETTIFKPNFLTSLEILDFKCVIVPDSEWCKGKVFPTETDIDGKEVRIINSYMRRNMRIFGYGDKYGWAYHELFHASIASGQFPSRFNLESKFGYPLNSDEIYCYGWQLKKLAEERKIGLLIKWLAAKAPELRFGISCLCKGLDLI